MLACSAGTASARSDSQSSLMACAAAAASLANASSAPTIYKQTILRILRSVEMCDVIYLTPRLCRPVPNSGIYVGWDDNDDNLRLFFSMETVS